MRRKKLDCGFIILCLEKNTHLVNNTIKSIKNNYKESPIICIADNSCSEEDGKYLNSLCPSFIAGDTISSLINCGFKNTNIDWNFVLIAGTTMRNNLDYKYSEFINSENDVLFPIVDRKINFVDGTINGLMINKKLFQKTGNWDDNLPLDKCKLLWAISAMEFGGQFKGIIGARLC